MIGHLVRPTDFERVLRTRSHAMSSHFAIHYLDGFPSRPAVPRARMDASPVSSTELCTGDAPGTDIPVDDRVVAVIPVVEPPPWSAWLGTVVPKRHARRAVTRTLLKRQIRSVALGAARPLASGLWVVRLRAPFDRAVFPSAASEALRLHARDELQHLFAHATERLDAR